MLNIACAVVTLVCLICCAGCLRNCTELKKDRDDITNKRLNTIKDLQRSVELNDEVIGYCKTLIKYNERLTDINADLRLELEKEKE